MLRLYCDEHGESHFDTVDVAMALHDDSPPASRTTFRTSRGQDLGFYPVSRGMGWQVTSFAAPPDHHLYRWSNACHHQSRRSSGANPWNICAS